MDTDTWTQSLAAQQVLTGSHLGSSAVAGLAPVMMIVVAMVIGGVLCVELGSHKEPAKE